MDCANTTKFWGIICVGIIWLGIIEGWPYCSWLYCGTRPNDSGAPDTPKGTPKLGYAPICVCAANAAFCFSRSFFAALLAFLFAFFFFWKRKVSSVLYGQTVCLDLGNAQRTLSLWICCFDKTLAAFGTNAAAPTFTPKASSCFLSSLSTGSFAKTRFRAITDSNPGGSAAIGKRKGQFSRDLCE